MKKISLFCLALSCIGLQSCKNNQEEKAEIPAETPSELAVQKSVSSECYQAIYEQDTLMLKLNTLESGEITGDMTMTIENMPTKQGNLAGEFKGDTLYASYTFIQGDYKEKTYKNPMAFLKKGDQLILGNGEIQTTMGASYFVKGKPIDFERVKYKFDKVACE
ncbi:hypothetical protein HNQ02_003571 [Flavobacterium sp. 7E]|uniref:hypothetical protein n=1 Tax=unclassified Flavobacterium TaxID=196869 RepID=UPI00157126F4|nr:MULTISPECIES: hypothetical protein [unclassified Flavobacterium]MBE0393848.1 hypothetical protein [Flavobacterium sp. PL002]NRS90625.1 hypothetical protein [Flavobacterium sp. 7E]